MNWTGLGVEFICIVEWDVIEGADDGSERDGCFTTHLEPMILIGVFLFSIFIL